MTAPGGFWIDNTLTILSEPGAFGFLEPGIIIRAVHLIPAFAHGRTAELLRGVSMARQCTIEDADTSEPGTTNWLYYCVNM